MRYQKCQMGRMRDFIKINNVVSGGFNPWPSGFLPSHLSRGKLHQPILHKKFRDIGALFFWTRVIIIEIFS